MADESSVRWWEVMQQREGRDLPFADLYREYAEALREKERARKAQAFWPTPK